MKLYPIDINGHIDEPIQMTDFTKEVCKSASEMYSANGFILPWIGYLAISKDRVVGTCAFKSPPQNGKVEIAYFTFPENENKGIGTEMAKHLLKIARDADFSVKITAQTMPEKNASTRILEKLNFQKVRTVKHPDDGDVWEWEIIE